MIKPGDCVYFKDFKKSAKNQAAGGRFKGYGFGLFLGIVPPFAPDPNPTQLMQMMGSSGFLSFDDVGEFFGHDKGVECVKKFEEKYYPKPKQNGESGKPEIIQEETGRKIEVVQSIPDKIN